MALAFDVRVGDLNWYVEASTRVIGRLLTALTSFDVQAFPRVCHCCCRGHPLLPLLLWSPAGVARFLHRTGIALASIQDMGGYRQCAIFAAWRATSLQRCEICRGESDYRHRYGIHHLEVLAVASSAGG